MQKTILLLCVLFSFVRCDKAANTPPVTADTTMYFPQAGQPDWETVSPAQLGWNTRALSDLKQFLIQSNTKSFIVLFNGRIAMEEYFNGHSATASWEWNSAGKTLTSAMTGIAQQEGKLNIEDRVSDYLGDGWTSMPIEQENLITVRNLLSMTSGIDDAKHLVIKANLTYVADAGARWAYGNVFQKLMPVIASAAGTDFETYFNEKLKARIGMEGFWNFGVIFSIYHSNTRSMARFGLLALNKGKWDGQQIINESYFNASVNSSQNINPSYGYLWWLNGKSSYMIPGSQTKFSGPLISSAPANMYAAMGANDQRIYVIPDRRMVIIRMGEASDPENPSFAVSGFDNALWEKINAVIR